MRDKPPADGLAARARADVEHPRGRGLAWWLVAVVLASGTASAIASLATL